MHRQIGTEGDNHKFRQSVQQTLSEAGAIVKTCNNEISSYADC